MRIRIRSSLASLTFVLLFVPASAIAGGTQFPGDGTRGLGRGGAIMARPDDPFVMARNPALLSDLWGSQLYINTQIGLPHNCSQLSGGYGWGYNPNIESVVSTGPGDPPLYAKPNLEEGSMGGSSESNMVDISPSALPYWGEPYPEICYSAGATLIPNVVLTTKLSDEIGVGIGFMPPELYQNNGMGGMDGVIDTPLGKRPDPMRYLEPMNQDVTYFGLLGAIGYRVLPWLRIGAGFRWTMVIPSVEAWNNVGTQIEPMHDVRADFYGQDLFIPGFTASVHVVPFDSLDMAIGYRWEDHVRMNNAKIDFTTGPLSYYGVEDDYFLYQDPDGVVSALDGYESVVTENLPSKITAEPPTVPQLSFGIRFADRIRPRPEKYIGLDLAKDPVRDPMADENWDIEFDAIYYFTSTYKSQTPITEGKLVLGSDWLTPIQQPDGSYVGNPNHTGLPAGICLERDAETNCIKAKLPPKDFMGKDQWSLRLGGDYNPIPDVLALRLGVSYETRGQDPEYVRPTWSMPFERLGVHGGFTWRIDGRTDISFGYAHFFQETIRLMVNYSEPDSGFPSRFRLDRETGNTLSPEEVDQKYHVVPESEADGTAMIPIHSGTYTINSRDTKWGKYYANAGTHKSGLDVFSISIMRHF